MLRLWEVVSVVQDLPYDRQLEIIKQLQVKSVLTSKSFFESYFLLPDHRLAQVAKKYIGSKFTVDDVRNVTRLSILYIILLSSPVGLNNRERHEVSRYFTSLPIEIQVQLRKFISPYESRHFAEILTSTITNYTLKHGIADSVRSLFSIGTILYKLFTQAEVTNNDKIVYQLLDETDNLNAIRLYAIDLLNEAKAEYFSYAIGRWIEVSGKEEQEAEELFLRELFPADETIIIPDWVKDGKVKTRVRMLLDVAPNSDLDAFVPILHVVLRQFSTSSSLRQ